MSILDRVDDGTFETLVSGEGHSVMYEPVGGRLRFDVWHGDTWRAVPSIASREEIAARGVAALDKLRRDVERAPEIRPPVERLAAALAVL